MHMSLSRRARPFSLKGEGTRAKMAEPNIDHKIDILNMQNSG